MAVGLENGMNGLYIFLIITDCQEIINNIYVQN